VVGCGFRKRIMRCGDKSRGPSQFDEVSLKYTMRVIKNGMVLAKEKPLRNLDYIVGLSGNSGFS